MPDEELWFRGVSSNTYQLIPSLLRCFEEKDRTRDNIRSLENDLFFEFVAKARMAEGATTLTDWDVLFLMQHYRAPTRLLDWTEVLHVALYFAIAYRIPERPTVPRIYLLNPYLWNEEHDYSRDLYWPRYFGYDESEDYYYDYGEILVDSEGIDWEAPAALYPPQRNARLSAQRGYFTIHGSDTRPIDEIAPKLVVAIDIEPGAIAEIQEQLSLSGTNEFALFPDLEGLARHLRVKYRLDQQR